MTEPPMEIRLSDYTPYPFRVDSAELSFDLHEEITRVDSRLEIRRVDPEAHEIFLDGRDLELHRVRVDGRELQGNEYRVDDDGMTIFGVEDSFVLEVSTSIYPHKNTRLMGLYKSRGTFCTQCEAEGFRRMTYFPDRPDVQSIFTTNIEADPRRYPILLSNGNPTEQVELENGRVRRTWHDPFHKPSYLFAMVAGDLDVLEDSFTTRSGRTVALRIYSESKDIGQCRHAMDALKAAMRWDEEAYGREYDLDIFMIVAVPDFNFGAMENKGLNVFNTMALLASPDTATDSAYNRITGVVGHEYFHNWSGNRVTCREWFQLSLKEGFTVFRDSQFSGDMNSRTIKRVHDVNMLRTVQFAEDAGPLAHPVRPDRYSAIANFYSATVYNKGAEVVRMLHTILGIKRFRAGTDLYFKTFDGSAATTEDFVQCMERVSGVNLEQFRRWYTQAGTPELQVNETRLTGSIELDIRQTCPPTPGQPTKDPFHIPVALGVIDREGREVLGAEGSKNGYSAILDATVKHENPNQDGTLVLHLEQPAAKVRISGVPEGAAVSFLRGFSAPVRVKYPQPAQTRIHLAMRDTDGFTRWDSARSTLNEALGADAPDWTSVLALFEELVAQALASGEDSETSALLNAAMAIPSPLSTLQLNPGQDIFSITDRTENLMSSLAVRFQDSWHQLADLNQPIGGFEPTKEASARRAMHATALMFIRIGTGNADEEVLFERLKRGFRGADNLSDRLSNMEQIVELRHVDESRREALLEEFRSKWEHEELVMLEWFRLQAGCTLPGGLDRVERLREHPGFKPANPNFVRTLFGAFMSGNLRGYHDPSGEGYEYIVNRVLDLEGKNGHLASLLLTQMSKWQDFDSKRQHHMVFEMRRVQASAKSKEVLDKVDRSLKNAPLDIEK